MTMAVSFRWPAVLRDQPAPLLAISAAGWALLGVHDSSNVMTALCLSSGMSASAELIAVLTLNPLWLVLSWLLMLLAMMSPLLAQPLLYLWQRSLRRRHWRALALFTLGYGTIWLAAGIVLTMLAIGLSTSPLPGLALALLIALAWQVTPLKQASLNNCHRHPPLAAFGLRADTDALHYGLTHGVWCVGACWALMLLPLMASQAHLAVMAIVMLVQLVERERRTRSPRWGAALLPLSPDAAQLRAGEMGSK
jgi:predicted metal-binding membrane protein